MTSIERAKKVITDTVPVLEWGSYESIITRMAKEFDTVVAVERAACIKVFEDCNDPETGEFLEKKREEADRLKLYR